MTRLFEPETIERELAHLRAELDRLAALAAQQRERALLAEGTDAAAAIRVACERELEQIRRRLARAQLSLVHHPSDRRYGAAQNLLREAARGDGRSWISDLHEVAAA